MARVCVSTSEGELEGVVTYFRRVLTLSKRRCASPFAQAKLLWQVNLQYGKAPLVGQ